ESFPFRISGSPSAKRKNRRARWAVENGVAVEIDKGCLRRLLLDDFHELLGKASAKNASALPHLPQPRRLRLTMIHSAWRSISRLACTKLCGKTLQSMGRSQRSTLRLAVGTVIPAPILGIRGAQVEFHIDLGDHFDWCAISCRG